MAQVAIDMDQDGPENPLQYEKGYFDGCHSGCFGFKTLALFIYHQAIWHILQLATMEVKMSQHMKSVCSRSCLIRFLARLQRVRDYTYNAKAIMVYENVPTIAKSDNCLVLIL